MWQLQKSGLFKRQLLSFAKDYKDRTSIEVAEKFLDATEAAIAFIADKHFLHNSLVLHLTPYTGPDQPETAQRLSGLIADAKIL